MRAIVGVKMVKQAAPSARISQGCPQRCIIDVMGAATTDGKGRMSADLIRSGEVTREQVYAAALVLSRLQDRGVGHRLAVEDICEVLGYIPEPEPESMTTAPRP